MEEEEIDYKSILMNIFGNTNTVQQINDAISNILFQQFAQTPMEKLEKMIELLVVTGDSATSQNILSHSDDEAEACAILKDRNVQECNLNFDQIISMFPDICPTYLSEFCNKYDFFDLNTVIQDLLKVDYAKLDKDPLDIWEKMKEMLPNADPIYLRNQARVLAHRPIHELEEFLQKAVEESDYPTMQEYITKKEQSSSMALYFDRFIVADFVAAVPNPVDTFLSPNRKPITFDNEFDVEYALNFLYNQFPYQRKREIRNIFLNNKHLVQTCGKLKHWPKQFRRARISDGSESEDSKEKCKNISLLQEITFIKNEKIIRQFVKQQDTNYSIALQECKLHNLLQTCGCCFDDQLIPEECYFCNKNCPFCKECVRLGAENVIGRGETTFPCLADCNSEFHFSTLQMVLDKKTFRRLCQRKQIEEIKNANIDGLETCPFCDFSMIPREGDKIFKCANDECRKESCRECRHVAHVPKRCSEMEYDEDVKMRTYIENKMSEALLRQCWKCQKSFYKESGCNKMTCPCGARMCYICGQAITDYTHFNAGCPLYTDNLHELHLNRVLEAAQSAKNELGVDENPNKLKFDPTKNLIREQIK